MFLAACRYAFGKFLYSGHCSLFFPRQTTVEVKIASAQGLADCKKLLMLAKAGKYNGYLLEGMGCPGGCIGGAGTIADPVRTAAVLNKYVKDAGFHRPRAERLYVQHPYAEGRPQL